jgi:hypothetical protein
MVKFFLFFFCLFGYAQAWDDRDFNSPLWEVDLSSTIDRVFLIEERLNNIYEILVDNFEEEDPDVKKIMFKIKQIRADLFGIN